MRLESLEAYPISLKIGESLKGGTFAYAHYQTVLARAVVDGVEGWGEAMTRFDPDATALIVRFLGRSLVGQEFGTVKEAWGKVWRELRVRGHTRGTDVEALSGIEMALYDCLGRIERKPLGRLFSSSPMPEVPVFAGSLFASRGPLGDQVEKAKSGGLSGAKVKVGFGVEEDSRILTSVRKLWPEGMLVADANGAYESSVALEACQAFRGLDLAWFEEPVPSDDFAGYAELRKAKVRIGAGESWFVGDFDGAISGKLVGVLEPSVSRCGGVGVLMDAAERAGRMGIGFSPMTGMNSAISVAASLQGASARQSLGVEFNPFTNPLQSGLATGIGEPKNGTIKVPGGYGLGIEVDTSFVKAHSR
jgi:D-galactarolactone cycloisomerase